MLPTYRELGLEMDSRAGASSRCAGGRRRALTESTDTSSCLPAGCESACPSGVRYGRMVEDARAEIEALPAAVGLRLARRWFSSSLQSRAALSTVGTAALFVRGKRRQGPGCAHSAVQVLGRLGESRNCATAERRSSLADADVCDVARSSSVRLLHGALYGDRSRCARLMKHVRCCSATDARWWCPTPGCCAAAALHAGLRGEAQKLACRNIDACWRRLRCDRPNAAGCGSTLKEYRDYWKTCPNTLKGSRVLRLMRELRSF